MSHMVNHAMSHMMNQMKLEMTRSDHITMITSKWLMRPEKVTDEVWASDWSGLIMWLISLILWESDWMSEKSGKFPARKEKRKEKEKDNCILGLAYLTLKGHRSKVIFLWTLAKRCKKKFDLWPLTKKVKWRVNQNANLEIEFFSFLKAAHCPSLSLSQNRSLSINFWNSGQEDYEHTPCIIIVIILQ